MEAKKSNFNGPCYLKMLVNHNVAGSVIGKCGAVISQIEQDTGCHIRLSASKQFFPGTQDRIVIMSGEQENINKALTVILEKIKEASGQSSETGVVGSGKISARIVLPKSAVSAIIGKGGQQIKTLQESTGARIQISSREEGLEERIVTISGMFEPMQTATIVIATSLQCDPNLKDHMYLIYKHSNSGYMGSPLGLVGLSSCHGQYNQQAFMGMQPNNHMQSHHQMSGLSPGHSEMMGQPCEIVVQIPDKFVGPVIGRNGSCLSDIMNQSGARIQISQKGEMIYGTTDRRCVIKGSVGSVHMAHIMLLQRLQNADVNSNRPAAPGSFAQQTPNSYQTSGQLGLSQSTFGGYS